MNSLEFEVLSELVRSQFKSQQAREDTRTLVDHEVKRRGFASRERLQMMRDERIGRRHASDCEE